MDMTSHLLAALNLPPIRDVASPYQAGTEQQSKDRPLPLEPSTSQDAFSSSQQYPPSLRDLTRSLPHQSPPAGSTSDSNGDAQVQGNSQTDVRAGPPESPPRVTEMDSSDSKCIESAPNTNAPLAPMFPPVGGQIDPPSAVPLHATPMPAKSGSTRRVRRKWTEGETQDLIKGCHEHGVGNWKRMLDDPKYTFSGRSSVDLKDRFRTCFPKEYRKPKQTNSHFQDETASDLSNDLNLRPPEKGKRKATKTEVYHAEVLEKLGMGGSFPKVQRRERREFTTEEDSKLLQGFTLYGASWSRIQNDAALHLSHRRSTDLRDRFRNAFPDRYESAGFKARPRQRPKAERDILGQIKTKTEGPANGITLEETEDLDESSNGDSSTLLMHSLLEGNLSPSWGTQETLPISSDQSPAPGSLALDPALNEGFSGSSLEQITQDFLGVQAGIPKEGAGQNSQEVCRWEEMAARFPVFELEQLQSTDATRKSSGGRLDSIKNDRKRGSECANATNEPTAKKQRFKWYEWKD